MANGRMGHLTGEEVIKYNTKRLGEWGEHSLDTLTPVKAVQCAFSSMILAKKLSNYIEYEKIELELLNKPIRVIDRERVYTFAKEWDSKGVKATAKNIEIATEQSLVIIVDCAMDVVFGRKPIINFEDDIGAARATVYMLRCAFAHSIYNPIWQVTRHYRHVCEVKEIGLKVDLTELDGKESHPNQLGGWGGFLSLMTFCKLTLEASCTTQ